MTLIKVLLNIVNNIGAAVFGGWVITMLWGWFVVTTFGVAPLSIVAAIGLGLFVNFFTKHPRPSDASEEVGDFNRKMIWIKPLVFLIAGYIVQLFM